MSDVILLLANKNSSSFVQDTAVNHGGTIKNVDIAHFPKVKKAETPPQRELTFEYRTVEILRKYNNREKYHYSDIQPDQALNNLLEVLPEGELEGLLQEVEKYNPKRMGYIQFSRFLSYAKSLEKLTIKSDSFSKFLDNGLSQHVPQSLGTLRELRFESPSINSRNWVCLIGAASQLKTLYIKSWEAIITKDFISQAQNGLKNLTCLQLDGVAIKDISAFIMLLSLTPTLEKLEIKASIPREQVSFLKAAADESIELPNLRELQFDCENGLDLFLFILSSSTTLEKLTLRQYLRETSSHASQSIQNLKSLVWGGLTSDDSLLQFLKSAPSLRFLHLNNANTPWSHFNNSQVLRAQFKNWPEHFLPNLECIRISNLEMTKEDLDILRKIGPENREIQIEPFNAYLISRSVSEVLAVDQCCTIQ